MTYRICTTQTFTVTRTIVHEIEADTLDEALLEVEFGNVEAPAFDEKGWMETWSLNGEEQGVVR